MLLGVAFNLLATSTLQSGLLDVFKNKVLQQNLNEFPSAHNVVLDGDKLKMDVVAIFGNKLGTYQDEEFYDFIWLDNVKYEYDGVYIEEVEPLTSLGEDCVVIKNLFIYKRIT